MKRNAIGLILTLGLLSVSPLAAQFAEAIDCQPLVIYDVSGYGIGGPNHSHLAVYSDGLTSISSLVLTSLRADFTFVPEERVYRLVEDLALAGALELGDRWESVADMPMTTVTLFADNGASALHNTFSFYDTGSGGARDPYRNVVAILSAFIAEAFPPA